MKKRSHPLILAALALGLYLPPPALPQDLSPDFSLVNNSDSTLGMSCASSTLPSVFAGETAHFSCNGTVKVQSPNDVEHTFSFQCATNDMQHTTVTMSQDGGLSLAHDCEPPQASPAPSPE